MPRLMYDSVTAADIPRGALMVAGYTDGAYAWSEADWELHARARQVRICAVSLDPLADVADIETGALSAAQGAAFVKLKQSRGEWPTLYFSASRLGEVHNALVAAGVNPAVGWSSWIALWDGRYVPYLSAVAKQYANPTITGGHYDLSWVANYWPGVDPAPAVPPPPPVPPPPVPPPVTPPTPANLDQARASWSALGELLISDFPAAIAKIAAAVTKVEKLP